MDIYQHIYGHPESCSTLLPPHTNEQRDGHLCKWSGTEIQMNLKRAQPCYSIWMNDYALAILSYSPRQFVQRSINNINNIWSTPPDRQRRSSSSICSPTSILKHVSTIRTPRHFPIMDRRVHPWCVRWFIIVIDFHQKFFSSSFLFLFACAIINATLSMLQVVYKWSTVWPRDVLKARRNTYSDHTKDFRELNTFSASSQTTTSRKK